MLFLNLGLFTFESIKSIAMAKRSLAATVRSLEAKLKRKQLKEAKVRAKAALKTKAEQLRKKLRGY